MRVSPFLRRVLAFGVLATAIAFQPAAPRAFADETPQWSVVVHGGAGLRAGQTLPAKRETAMRDALAEAAEAAAAIVRTGGTSLDAVEAAVRLLEDDLHFNAGKGSVFTAAGANELDASIMDGATLKAGAVAGVTTVKNPITLARAVMERSPHVMMAGDGAEAFAAKHDVTRVERSYFATEERWRSLERRLERDGQPVPEAPQKWGTVGAVVRDLEGRLAAATSTGGMTAKLYGRVGDSPIIGAGTYADGTCAVSSTGHGEYFIRLAIAHRVCARVALLGEDVQTAADYVIHEDLTNLRPDDAAPGSATGGVIVVGADGTAAWSFNSAGMFRARITANTSLETGVYGPGDVPIPAP